jgi:hypothetical protein
MLSKGRLLRPKRLGIVQSTSIPQTNITNGHPQQQSEEALTQDLVLP